MNSDIYWIDFSKIGKNKIGIMAHPKGNDCLDNEIKSLKERKIDYLVSLLEKSEELELGLLNEDKFCKKWGINFICFPIKDINTPENESDFIQLAKDLATIIQNNKNIVIHCRMGIGRSSILAAATMIVLGYEGKEAFEIISNYRKLKVPDTDEQKNWVLSIESHLSKTK